MIWDEDAVDTLRAMAKAGKSYGEVAELFGCTRSAVAGKANRLGVRFACDHRAARLADGTRRGWAKMSPAAKAERIRKTCGAYHFKRATA